MHGRLNSVKTRHASVMGALFYVMGITSAMAMPAPVENKTLQIGRASCRERVW